MSIREVGFPSKDEKTVQENATTSVDTSTEYLQWVADP